MKAVKIPTNEKEVKKFLEGIQDYAQKRGIRIYAIIGYSSYCESTVAILPDLEKMVKADVRDVYRFLDNWHNSDENLTQQMKDFVESHKPISFEDEEDD